MGADVIKVERAGEGDATRAQLRDIPDADSLYFTMLNHNKRLLITLEHEDGQGPPRGARFADPPLRRAVGGELAPGALDRMGVTWSHIQDVNPRMILASVKGWPGMYEDCKVYENVAWRAGGAASTTGFDDFGRPPSAARRSATAETGLHRAGHRGGALPARDLGPRLRACSRRCRTRC